MKCHIVVKHSLLKYVFHIEIMSWFLFNLYFEVHARRLQSLKALTYAPSTNSDILSRLYEIVFGILEKVCTFLFSLRCIYNIDFCTFIFNYSYGHLYLELVVWNCWCVLCECLGLAFGVWCSILINFFFFPILGLDKKEFHSLFMVFRTWLLLKSSISWYNWRASSSGYHFVFSSFSI
jgi:hypothetical protein